MRWELSEAQRELQVEFGAWLDRAADSAAVRASWADEGRTFQAHLAAEGWLAIGMPEAAGGAGGGLLDLALAAEVLGGHAAASGAWLATAIAAPALDVERLATVIEDGAFAALVVPADRIPDDRTSGRSGDGVRASADGTVAGRVSAVLGGDLATTLIVPVLDSAAVASLICVDGADGGLERTPVGLLDPSRVTADLGFEAVEGQVVSGDPSALLAEMALRAAVLVAADSLGAAQRMLDLTVEYSLQREQFGVPIGSFQAVKHAAASMLVSVEAARSITYAAAAALEQGHPDARTYALAAKAQVTGSVASLADSALNLHGAIGYTWEHDLQLFYKRAKLNAALFGAPVEWNERLAGLLPLVPRE